MSSNNYFGIVLPLIYQKDLDAIRESADQLRQKFFNEEGAWYSSFFVLNHGYYSLARGASDKHLLFFPQPILKCKSLLKEDSEELYNKMIEIESEERFTRQFVTSCLIKYGIENETLWLFTVFPKICTDHFCPNFSIEQFDEYKDFQFNEADKPNYEKFKRILSRRAVETFLL